MKLDLATWFTELYIQDDVWDSPVAERVRSLVQAKAIRVNERPFGETKGLMSGQEFDHSKRRLYLGKHAGQFFKKCPGVNGAACCNYYVLNLGAQCNMNCTYCYLQSYLNSPVTQVYANLEDALIEMEQMVAQNPEAPFRVGTGETIDSLSLDDLTLYSKRLVEWFSKFPQLTLEFKTKSTNVKNFIDLKHAGNVVVSFSINPQIIVSSEEHRTASLQERLETARLCADRGFPVAFHIDPMMAIDDWQKHYTDLVEQVTSVFKPHEVRWISIGALRYLPEMKQILRERFGGSTETLRAELFMSAEGKLRYDGGLRNRMFTHVLGEFRKRGPYPSYLCMESNESWVGTFSTSPRRVEGIKDLFAPI